MSNNIRKYFCQDNLGKLESQLKVLGSSEIQWIIDDIEEANGIEKYFQIIDMKFNSNNKSINLGLKEKSTNEGINRVLIL